VGAREERVLGGIKYWIMPVESVPPGGRLEFTLHGLPSRDATGRNVAGTLALALIAGAFGFGRRSKKGGKGGRAGRNPDDDRARLIDRREALFGALVTLEGEAAASGGPAPADRRKQLVGELEQVYRQLAALDEQRAA
jgi:hypothetical protein